MIPGYPPGGRPFGLTPIQSIPTVRELRRIFDELGEGGELSEASWAALFRLGQALEGGAPHHIGELVCRLDPEEFRAAHLEGSIADSRLEALLNGDEPTADEVRLWQDLRFLEAQEWGSRGPFMVAGWHISDDTGRDRILVTLHVDQGTIEHVAGLYRSPEQVVEHLAACGSFRWL